MCSFMLPITQYFKYSKQADFVRSHCSSSSGECGRPQPHVIFDLFEERHQHHHRHPSAAPLGVPPRKVRLREKRLVHVKERRKQSRTYNVTIVEPSWEQCYEQLARNNINKIVNKLQEKAEPVAYPQRAPPRRPRSPSTKIFAKFPDLLHTTKRKKTLGFISRCLFQLAPLRSSSPVLVITHECSHL